MGWPARITMVRHAESEGNLLSPAERPSLDKATHEYELTKRGLIQAEVTSAWLRHNLPEPDTRYVSYYRRARDTMSILQPGQRVYEDPRLAEAQRGIYATYSPDEVREHFPLEGRRKKREGLYHYRPPGGENWPDVELRIHSFLTTLARDQAGKQVLIVVHGHWLILLQRMIHHFSIEEAMERYRDGTAPNASVTSYVTGVSDRLHLEMEHFVPNG